MITFTDRRWIMQRLAIVLLALMASVGKSGTYNIATGTETDVMRIWNGLREAALRARSAGEASAEVALPEPQLAELRPGELLHSCLDPSLAERELGWRAAVPISEGLARTYDALVAGFQHA